MRPSKASSSQLLLLSPSMVPAETDLPSQLHALQLTVGSAPSMAIIPESVAAATEEDDGSNNDDNSWGWFEDIAPLDEEELERFQVFHRIDINPSAA
ncbi:Aste57867_15196 [Aphanomyces stellatus]|uniref:Aste57867_15196 protein n=1 Tax=Aphanomyces stellatus TaxID=120398 RepID=A0A485L2V2_9STRA|nr:hypothetical protein As57867_015140 [Aphanomyces stellatus]VFT92005.1 Aste57867_15196 [Aphanomyces stellatus]